MSVQQIRCAADFAEKDESADIVAAATTTTPPLQQHQQQQQYQLVTFCIIAEKDELNVREEQKQR